MRSALIPMILLVALVGSMTAWHFSPEKTAERDIRHALEQISLAAEAEDQLAILTNILVMTARSNST